MSGPEDLTRITEAQVPERERRGSSQARGGGMRRWEVTEGTGRALAAAEDAHHHSKPSQQHL